jgi:hypothetical protein
MRVPALVIVTTAAAVFAAPAFANNPPHPSGLDQPLKDGCQRSDFGIGLGTSPQWVYVYRNAAIRTAKGTVRISHGSIDDSILQHDSYDYNGNLVPDRPYRYLVAGTPQGKTNNFARQPGSNSDEEYARLHFEWESGTLPMWAWPQDGDRAQIWGAWIWDCGHWSTTENNAEGSTTTGEHTELHPLNAIVDYRVTPFTGTRKQTQTDVFISNDGTVARAVENCALSHHPKDNANYDDGFRPCTESKANRVQPLLRSYSFTIPAPRKPATAGAELHYKVVGHGRSSARQRIRVTHTGLSVTVTMKRAKSYGKTFYVWWTPQRATPTLLRFTLQSVKINHADPNPNNAGSDPDKTPPPWNLYLDVNGSWKLLNDWAPQLGAVHDGQVIPVNRSFTIAVPKGAGVWLQVQGRECDEPGDTTVFGLYAHVLFPCGPNRDEINPNPLLLLMNDDVGIVLDRYRFAALALGTHTSAAATSAFFPGSGQITFGHGVEAGGAYELTYTVSKG